MTVKGASTRWRCVGRLTLSEVSGSLGDLGILIPLTVGMAHQGSVHLVPALFFAGLWNVLTGFLWDVPMCVQPMKTIAAVALADGLTRVQVSLAGMIVSACVLLLGLTRGIMVINNIVPLAVVRGMQLGLGLSLARRGIDLIIWARSTASCASSAAVPRLRPGGLLRRSAALPAMATRAGRAAALPRRSCAGGFAHRPRGPPV